MKPLLVLTRPEPQSREIAAALGEDVTVIVSPVMRIVAATVLPDLQDYAGIILTSANGVVPGLDLAGKRAYCVGKRTGKAATRAGAEVALTARDANDLVARIETGGPLLHLRGQHARGNISYRMNSAGIETHEAVIYAQEALPLTLEARLALEGNGPVILPLYSPRSAQLVGEQIGTPGTHVQTISMSDAVARAWRAATGAGSVVVDTPIGESMLIGIHAALKG